MKIYLAASYSDQERMRKLRDEINDMGHEVVSTWIDNDGPGMDADQINQMKNAARSHAHTDMADIRRCDLFVVFTNAPSTTGGMHVEFGYALGLQNHTSPRHPISLAVVGPFSNIFHAAVPLAKFDQPFELLDWLSHQ